VLARQGRTLNDVKWRSWWRWTGRWPDGALTLGLLIMGIFDVVQAEADQIAGTAAANAILAVLVAVAFWWRRRYPIAVVAFVTTAILFWATVLYPDKQPPFMPAIALLLCSYTAASSTASPWPLAAFAAVFAVEEAGAVLRGRPPGVGERVSYWVLLALAGGLGVVVRRQRTLADALRDRTRSLEREQEETARLAVTLERARIARELHDLVTHNVTTMVIQASVEGRMLGEQGGATREALGAIEQIGRETLVELRSILGVLRRDGDRRALAPPPTLDRLEELVDQVRQAGLPVDLHVDGARVPLPAGVELSAYRIVQEALTNCLRHASAAHAWVVVRYRQGGLELDVCDDGRGTTEPVRAGHGLTGMRERAAVHGGTLRAGPATDGGYRVHAEIPVATL
jgi:signal transduction histidine kinase